MKMYSNKFVMCVLLNGEPQKELANNSVSLPFGSEYALRFRNKHNVRAVVKISIDGENVSGGGYVIEAGSHIDIKRHFDKDKSFKFVSLDSSEAIDFGKNGPNKDKTKGTIEAKFYLEKHEIQHTHSLVPQPFIKQSPIWPNFPPSYPPNYPPNNWPHYEYPQIWCESSPSESSLSDVSPAIDYGRRDIRETRSRRIVKGSSLGLSTTNSVTNSSFSPSSSLEKLNDGCTVEGNSTGQTFHSIKVNLEETCTVLNLFLQGYHCNDSSNVIAAVKANNESELMDLKKENELLKLKAENELLRLQEENEKLKLQISQYQNQREAQTRRVPKRTRAEK